jgi:hypothetical protein
MGLPTIQNNWPMAGYGSKTGGCTQNGQLGPKMSGEDFRVGGCSQMRAGAFENVHWSSKKLVSGCWRLKMSKNG